jgi:hypothetical protein
MSEFQTYLPETWFEDGLAIAWSGAPAQAEEYPEVRAAEWRISMPASFLAGGVLALSSLLFSGEASASTLSSTLLPRLSAPSVAVRDRERFDPTLSPLKVINREFNQLFESFRSGTKLARSEGLKRIAFAATQKKWDNEDVNAWAKQLADDTKDADD